MVSFNTSEEACGFTAQGIAWAHDMCRRSEALQQSLVAVPEGRVTCGAQYGGEGHSVSGEVLARRNVWIFAHAVLICGDLSRQPLQPGAVSNEFPYRRGWGRDCVSRNAAAFHRRVSARGRYPKRAGGAPWPDN